MCVTQVCGAAYSGTFNKITTTDALTTGKYVIVGGTTANAMGAYSTYWASTALGTTINNDNTKITNPDEAVVWDITKDGSNYVISQTSSGTTKYVGFTGTSNNNNSFGTTNTDNKTKFTASVSSGSFTLTNVNYTSRQLKYNSSSPRFSNYSGQTALTIFKLEVTSPTVTVSGSLNNFTYAEGDGPSASQYVSVSGSNLTANMRVTAPTGYQVCQTEDGSYSDYVEITPSTGSVSSTRVYIRLKSDLSQGSYDGNITVSSTGATNQTKAVTGSVTAAVVKYTVTWHVGSNTSTTSNVPDQTAFSSLSAPEVEDDAAGSCANKFMGWATSAISGTTDAAGFNAKKVTGDTKVTSICKDFYAVFATQSGGSDSWEQIKTLANITDGTYVVICSGYYLTSTTNSSESPIAGTAPAISNSKITGTVTDEMKWFFSSTGTANQFYIKNAEDKYLYANSSSTGLRVNTTSDKWTFATNTSGYFSMQEANNSRYCAKYKDGADWRSYTSATATNYANSGKIELYKLTGGSTYTDYLTECSTSAPDAPIITVDNSNHGYATVTISGSGSFFYTINGTNPTASSTAYSSELRFPDSDANVASSFTIKAIAANKYGSSEVSSQEVSITPLDGIAEMFTTAPTDGTNPWFRMNFGQWFVSGVNGIRAWFTDGAGRGFMLENSGHGFTMGDKITNAMTINGSLQKKNGDILMTNSNNMVKTNIPVTASQTVPVLDKTIAELSDANQGGVYKFTGVMYNSTGTKLEEGGNNVMYYDTYQTGYTMDNGRKYDITGVYVFYNNSGTTQKEISPRTAADIVPYYRVVYDGNAYAENVPSACDWTKGGSVIVAAPGSMAVTGATFQGWNTQSDGRGTSYSAGDNVTVSGADVVLYAQWNLTPYNITYNLNGGSWNGAEGAATYTYGTGVPTLATNVQKTGYRFAGWYDNEGLTGSAVTSIPTSATGAKQFWAKWVEQVTVTFQNNGANLAVGGSKTLDAGSALGEMPTLTSRDACDPTSTAFIGWTKQTEIATDGSDLQLASAADVINASTTYRAVWAEASAGGGGNTISSVKGTITTGDYYLVTTYNGQDVSKATAPYWGAQNYDSYGIAAARINSSAVSVVNDVMTIDLDQAGTAPKLFHITVNPSSVVITDAESNHIYVSTGNGGPNANVMKTSSPTTCDWDAITNEANGRHKIIVTRPNSSSEDVTKCLLLMVVTSGNNKAEYFKNYVLTNSDRLGGGESYYGSGDIYFLTTTTYSNYLINCSDTHTFTLDKNTGSADGYVTYTVGGTEPYDFSFTGTRTGYTLQGFNSTAGTNGAGGGTKVLNTDGTIANNYSTWVVDGVWKLADESKKFYAGWEAISYEVHFNGNGNTSGTMDSNQSFNYDQAKPLLTNKFGKTGYDFAGWARTADGPVAFSDKESVSNLASTQDAVVELYAKWTPKTFNITWDANGGTIESETTKKTPYIYDGASIELPTPDSREGYTFNGWWTTSGGGSSITEVGGTNKPTSDKTYYAHWTANTYTIAYDGNGSTGGTAMTNTAATYGVEVALKSNTYTKDGHTFAGWSTTAGGAVVYADGVTVSNLTATNGATVTLYAVWSCNQTAVTANGNGGLYAGAAPTCGPTDFSYGASVTATCIPSKTDYTFFGYTITQNGDDYIFNASGESVNRTGYFVDGRWVCTDATLTIYAKWVKTTCDVTYYTGLEGDVGTTIQVVGGTLAEIASPTSCDESRYHFEGWTTNGSYVESAEAPTYFDIATQPVEEDMTLHAVWSHGKNIYTQQTAEYPVAVGDKIIIVEPTNMLALTSLLLSAPVEETSTYVIETDETIFVWDVLDAGNDKLTLRGTNGNLHIGANTTNSLEVLDDAAYSTAEYKGFEIKRSDTRIYTITQSVAADRTRRVNYNKKKGIWNTYATRTAGHIYKKTSTNKMFSLDGYCAHEYLATGVAEMTSGKDVAVLSTTGMVTVSHTDKTPIAEKVSGDNVFEVIVNGETGTNFDGSGNYSYTVKFTPTAANTTYSAIYKFVGEGEHVGDAKVIASEEITFTGYSLPDQFAIVVNRSGQYYALPGGISGAGTPNAVPVTVVDGTVVDLGSGDTYHVGSGTVVAEDRTTIRLMNGTTALWATHADNSNINDYSGALTAANLSSASDAAKANTQWTLERYYRESDDEFLGYHLISDANKDKGLFYQNTSSHWGYYSNTYYDGSGYEGEIFFLPVEAEVGDYLDIVDWTTNSVTLNMNGYRATAGAWGIDQYGSAEKLVATDRAADRTLVVPTVDLVADKYVNLKAYYNVPSTPELQSNHNYKIPHIMTGTQTITSQAAYSANSVLYVKSGVTTINVNLTINKVIVNPGAELVIASGKTLMCRELVLRTEPWSAAVFTNHGTLTCDHVYYTRRGHSNKFQQFALPYECLIEDVRLSNGVTPAYAGASTGVYTIRRYDCAKRATNGIATDGNTNWETLTTGTIAAHTGYGLSVSNSYYREFYFPVTITGNTSVVVVPHTSIRPSDANWNFICSPLTSRATLNQPADPAEQLKICEMVDDSEIYWQHVPSTINPVIPFYYQAPANQTLEFSVSATVAARRTDSPLQTQWLKVVYENASGIMDETNLYINAERFTADYDMGYDETKMKSTSTRPQIYTQLACGDLAFAAIPDSMFLTPIPLAVYSPAEGEYTFSLEANEFQTRLESVLLIDTETGAQIDLMDGNYSATVPQGTTTNRFYLQGVFLPTAPIIPDDPGLETGLELQSGGQTIRKVFYQQRLYILRGEHIYDGTGKQVK